MGSGVTLYLGSSIGARCIRDPWHKLQTLDQTRDWALQREAEILVCCIWEDLENWYWKDIGQVTYQWPWCAEGIQGTINICTYFHQASLDSSSTILSYITSARLGDGGCKNGTHAFIINWHDEVRKYRLLDQLQIISLKVEKRPCCKMQSTL